jgi:hypothetical protein
MNQATTCITLCRAVRVKPSRPPLGQRQIRRRFRVDLKQKFFRVTQLCEHCFAIARSPERKVLGNVRFELFEIVHSVDARSKELVRLVLSDQH